MAASDNLSPDQFDDIHLGHLAHLQALGEIPREET